MRRFERTSTLRSPTLRDLQAMFIAVLGGGAAILGGCSATGVGDPCTPEAIPTCGFASTEVYIETSSVQCRTRVCVVYNLNGHPEVLRSEIPEGSDTCPGERPACITDIDRTICVNDVAEPEPGVEYPPDSINRVFCSCRCRASETNPDLPLCECGEGFHCSDEAFCVPHEADASYCSAEYPGRCGAACDLETERCPS